MKQLIAALAILVLAACATTDSLQPGTGGSTFEVRGKSYDEIWKAVVTVAGRSLTIVESDKSAGVLKAEKGVGLTTWGEVFPGQLAGLIAAFVGMVAGSLLPQLMKNRHGTPHNLPGVKSLLQGVEDEVGGHR